MTDLEAIPALEIIVVSYRCAELLDACLTSIAGSPSTRGATVVHVVDNASGDDTIERVRTRHPEVRLRALDRNCGFSVANNLILQEVVAPWVLILNPDTELQPGILDRLLDAWDRVTDVGMVGCRLVLRDGSFDHAAKRSFPTPIAALAHFMRIGRRDRARVALAQYRAPTVDEYGVGDVDAINGAFMLVRREAMVQVGPFDPGYWLYMEDLDWCRRFGDAGWRVVYDGRVTALHVKGGTAGARRATRPNIAFHRGMGRFYRRFDAGQQPLVDLAVYAAIVGKCAMSVTLNALAARRARSARRPVD